MKLISLDIETKCGVKECKTKNCWHALIPHLGQITTIGLHDGTNGIVFRDLEEFKLAISHFKDCAFVGHNFKFDLKFLATHGIDISEISWVHDTSIQASVVLEKVPEPYLLSYAELRKEVNKKLPIGYSHREGKALSLKVLAPYFLNVEPFWEDPTNHDSDEYVLKDCLYTWQLCHLLLEKMEADGTKGFYEQKLMPWARMLLGAELKGIALDLPLLEQMDRDAQTKMSDLLSELDREWEPAYEAYKVKVLTELKDSYGEKAEIAKAKLKDPTPEKVAKTEAKYAALYEKAIPKAETKLNLDSPTQMQWLLKDYFKLDTEVTVRDKKTNQKEIKDSTGSEVLQRLAMQGRKDIKTFLEYREQSKLVSSFFPTYRELQHKGAIHASFNVTGTRTGRLSSSDPNLQQVPGDLHRLFIARPGYVLGCYDQAAIEAKLIAYFSEDHVLYDLISQDKDIHGFHTVMFFELDCDPSEVKTKYKAYRDITKNIGFGLFYSAGAGRIQQEAMRNGLDWSMDDCRRKTKTFHETYETVRNFKLNLDKLAEIGPITNLFGRKLSFQPDEIYMKAFNSLVQSSASDLVLEASHRIQTEFKRRNIDAQVLLWVHDELVIEFPENRQQECDQIIRSAMTSFDLPTAFGPITLTVEGAIAKCWKK